MDFYDYTFEGQIVHHDVGYLYTVVFLPGEIAQQLPFQHYPRLRIEGEVAGQPFAGAWQPSRGRWYIMLSKPLLKAADVRLGDEVEVRFSVADQEAVDVPLALEIALNEDDLARQAWDDLTPGKRRGLTYRLTSAKTEPTREKRLTEILVSLRNGTAGQRHPPKKG